MSEIITEEMIRDRMSEFYDTGGGETFYVGFNGLARHYSIKEGGVTDWTGFPGSGKTELLLETLKNCSEWYGHKHLIYMPDAGTDEEVIAKLIHKFTGKQFEEYYFDDNGERKLVKNRITEAEMFKWLPQILEMFKIYSPPKVKAVKGKKVTRSKTLTPSQFWEYAVENKEKLGIFSAVIDSWNYMKHDTEGFGREDKWLEDTLSYRNELAEGNNLHFHTIIHPKAPRKDKTGKIIFPDMHDLKGGSEWGNNGKSIIIVHREVNSPITSVKIDKAKPRVIGVKGIACLKYDVKSGRFYENIASNGMQRIYSHKEHIIESNNNKMPNDFDSFDTEIVDKPPF
jgi:hypothetical protein